MFFKIFFRNRYPIIFRISKINNINWIIKFFSCFWICCLFNYYINFIKKSLPTITTKKKFNSFFY